MATTKIRDLTAVTTAAVGDKIPTDQSADNVTRYLTITQILDLLATVSQAEAEAGTATTRRAWTAARVKQAITALAPGTTLPVLAKSANYTLTTSDVRKLIDATANTWTLTLPTAATATDGFWFAVRNSGTGVITIDGDGSETIDGATTLSLVEGQAHLVICTGSAWKTVGRDLLDRVKESGGQVLTLGSVTDGQFLKRSGTTLVSATIDTQWTTSGSNIYYTTGNVGIGTTSPGNRLHVTAPAGEYTARLVGVAGELVGTELYLGGTQKGVLAIAGAANKAFGAGEEADEFLAQSDGAFSIWTGGVGSANRRLTVTSGGNVGIGTASPGNALQVVGTISGTVKNFQIPHPLMPTHQLTHSALEGPEIAVYYRGVAQLAAGEAVVMLPTYFEALVRPEDRTVQLTPVGGWSPLYVVSDVSNGQFTVRTESQGNAEQRFYWEVKGVRSDQPLLQVEHAPAAGIYG